MREVSARTAQVLPEWAPFAAAVRGSSPDAGSWCEAWTVGVLRMNVATLMLYIRMRQHTEVVISLELTRLQAWGTTVKGHVREE